MRDANAPLIAIFGAPAAGKTYWRTRIADHLGWPSLDIESMGAVGSGRWTRLIDQLESEDTPVIVESCAAPQPYRSMLRRCPSLTIHVAANPAERWARLTAREASRSRARELFAISGKPPGRVGLTIRGCPPECSVLMQVQARAALMTDQTQAEGLDLAC